MYNHEKEYRETEYENYEFENEAGSAFEMENEYEDEYNYEEEATLPAGYQGEMTGEYEYEDEYNYENESDYEFENEWEREDYEGQEYEDELRVRDHRSGRPYARPVNTAANRRVPYTPSRSSTRIPARQGRTVPNRYQPRPQAQTSSWYNRYRRPVSRSSWNNSHTANRHPHWNKRYWRNKFGAIPSPGAFDNMQAGMQGYPEMGNQPFPNYNTSIANPTQGSMPPQPDPGFQNYVLETLKNISNQLAASNESITALKSSSGNAMTADTNGQPSNAPMPAAGTESAQTATSPELEMANYEFEYESEGEVTDREGSFNETREMELASELLSLNNETELNYFIGSLLKKAAGAITGILKTPQGKSLAGLLKNVVKKALPIAGAAAGTWFGGPIGAKLGNSVGDAASKMFELEFEGLSNEDQEFETARAIVRLSGNAARQLMEQDSSDPQEDARQALIQASMLYAPGLIVRRPHRYRHFHNGSRRRF